MPTTRATVHVPASPARVYAALADPAAVERRRVPDGMHAEVHEYDARVGGRFRVSLTYDDAAGDGTDVELLHEGLPDGVPTEDNEAGTRMALARLRALVREQPAGQR